MQSRGQLQFAVPFTPMVKRLVILNVVIWVGAVLILQRWILSQPYIFEWFGLVPQSVVLDFWVWQPFSYLFIHSENVFHVIFNMLILWWFGADLEMKWGSRFFLLYYMVCGVGAAALYLAVVVVYSLISSNSLVLNAPVVGASGAIFGLMVAYAKFFGDRVIYFMMITSNFRRKFKNLQIRISNFSKRFDTSVLAIQKDSQIVVCASKPKISGVRARQR